MAMFGFMEVLMVVLSGGAGNELLDFLPSDAYWQRKGVTVSVEAMVAELTVAKPVGIPALVRDLGAGAFATREAASKKLRAMGAVVRPALEEAAKSDDPEVRERAKGLLAKLTEAGAKAKAVRRLMAIRTLGELKKPEALPALRPLLGSKELFVADYAREAMAAIEGKPFALPPPTKEMLAQDLGVLPPNCGVVAQAGMPGGQFSIQKALGDVGGMLPPGMDMAQIRDKLTEGILMVAERVGNVRLDRVTLGVAEDMGNGNDVGFVVIVARGLYDAAAVKAALRQTGMDAADVDGVDVLSPASEFRFIPFANDRLVLVGGPRRAVMPLKEIVAALKRPPEKLLLNKEVAELVGAMDVAQPLWAVAKVTENYRQVPVFAPFDTATLTTTLKKDGALAGTLVARGKDAEAVKGAAETIEKGIQEGLRELKNLQQRMPAMKPMLEFLESIKVEQKEATVTITAKLKGAFALPMMMPMFLLGARMGARPRAVVEEAVPAQRVPR